MRVYKSFYMFFLFITLTVLFASCNGSEKLEERYGVLFSTGEGIQYRSFVFEIVRPTRDPYPIQIGDRYGYSRNAQGAHLEMVTDNVFQMAKLFTEDLGAVKVDGKWGFIRVREGEEPAFEYAVPLMFESAEPFSEGLAAVKLNDLYGYIDTNKTMIIEPRFVCAHYFCLGMAAVETETGWSFIDRMGAVVIPGPFEDAESFTDFSRDGRASLAAVKVNGKWGYIDTNGEIALSPIYDEAWAFEHNGRAAVKLEGRWRLINVQGDFID